MIAKIFLTILFFVAVLGGVGLYNKTVYDSGYNTGHTKLSLKYLQSQSCTEDKSSSKSDKVPACTQVVFFVPLSLNEAQPKPVTLNVLPNGSDKKKWLKSTPRGFDAIVSAIALSSSLSVALKGQGLEFMPITPETQKIKMNHPGRWIWNVTSEKPGVRHLGFVLSGQTIADKNAGKQILLTFSQEVNVIKKKYSFWEILTSAFSRNETFIYTAMVIPFFGWLLSQIKKKFMSGKDKREKEGSEKE